MTKVPKYDKKNASRRVRTKFAQPGRDWKAPRIATATLSLTFEQGRVVDVERVQAVIGSPFGRALTVVERRFTRRNV